MGVLKSLLTSMHCIMVFWLKKEGSITPRKISRIVSTEVDQFSMTRQKSVNLEVDETGRTIFSESKADNLFVAKSISLI